MNRGPLFIPVVCAIPPKVEAPPIRRLKCAVAQLPPLDFRCFQAGLITNEIGGKLVSVTRCSTMDLARGRPRRRPQARSCSREEQTRAEAAGALVLQPAPENLYFTLVCGSVGGARVAGSAPALRRRAIRAEGADAGIKWPTTSGSAPASCGMLIVRRTDHAVARLSRHRINVRRSHRNPNWRRLRELARDGRAVHGSGACRTLQRM